MGKEIERKFLVNTIKLPELDNGRQIKQGYIQTLDNTVVRVRASANKAWLTIKGENVGASRLEFEYPIPLHDAQEMLDSLCNGLLVEKTRYEVCFAGHKWEIDIFEGKNQGLVLAEVELEDEGEQVDIPLWASREVTGEVRYYNSCLLTNPYQQWAEY